MKWGRVNYWKRSGHTLISAGCTNADLAEVLVGTHQLQLELPRQEDTLTTTLLLLEGAHEEGRKFGELYT